jgi:rhodanese-related sulfurtransferase
MIKLLSISLLSATFTLNAMAYDANRASENEKFYSHFTQKACADSKLFINAEDTMKLIRDNAEYLLLDVRSNGEASVIALVGNNTLQIPLEDLFKKENLDKLPANKQIIAVCHSGTRGLMATMGLKQIGIKNVQVLQGGLITLAEANTPKNAPMK